jgi:hypothetical protein
MITKANLDLELQDYLASTSNIKADNLDVDKLFTAYF